MKFRLFKYIVMILFAFTIWNCDDEVTGLSPTEEMIYRQIAFKSLTDDEQSSLSVNWEEAPVIRGFYSGNDSKNIFKEIDSELEYQFLISDDNVVLLDNQLLIRILFNTENDALLGPIILFVNPKTMSVIGFLPRF